MDLVDARLKAATTVLTGTVRGYVDSVLAPKILVSLGAGGLPSAPTTLVASG